MIAHDANPIHPNHGLLRGWTCGNCWFSRILALTAALAIWAIIGWAVYAAPPTKPKHPYRGGSDVPVITENQRAPTLPEARSPHVASRNGKVTVHYTRPDGTYLGNTDTRVEMRRDTWANRYTTESQHEQRMLTSIRNSWQVLATFLGHEQEQITRDKAAFHFALPFFVALPDTSPEFNRRMCMPESEGGLTSYQTIINAAPECGGGGGTTCGSCTCMTAIRRGNIFYGCGPMCSDCYHCIVCG